MSERERGGESGSETEGSGESGSEREGSGEPGSEREGSGEPGSEREGPGSLDGSGIEACKAAFLRCRQSVVRGTGAALSRRYRRSSLFGR